MKKLVILTLLLMAASLSSKAQYKAAFGVRFSGGPAVSMKFSTDNNEAAEGLLSGFGNGLKGTLLYEWHNSAFDSNQWRWYYGVGAHLGASPDRNWRNDRPGPDGVFHVGADGILGLEHTFREIPLNLSIDWKPEFNFVNYTGLALPVFGATGRLAF